MAYLPSFGCGGSPAPIVFLSPRGGARKVRFPRTALFGELASGHGRAAALWYARGGGVRSAPVGPGGVGKPVTHSAAAESPPDAAVARDGSRTVVWTTKTDMRLQRVRADGRADSDIALGARVDETEFAGMLDLDSDGTAWVQASGFENQKLRVFRIAPNGSVATIDLNQIASGLATAEFEAAVSDGRGGLYAVLLTDGHFSDQEAEDADEPSGGPSRSFVHLSRDGRVTRQGFTRGEAGRALLLQTSRGVQLAFEDGRGISVARVRPGGQLSRSRRLRRTGGLEAAAAHGSSIVILIRFGEENRRSSRRDGLAVQRFTPSGRHRAAIRVATGGNVNGQNVELAGGGLAVDSRGRIYVTWSGERDSDIGSGYARVVVRGRGLPRHRLWRCTD